MKILEIHFDNLSPHQQKNRIDYLNEFNQSLAIRFHESMKKGVGFLSSVESAQTKKLGEDFKILEFQMDEGGIQVYFSEMNLKQLSEIFSEQPKLNLQELISFRRFKNQILNDYSEELVLGLKKTPQNTFS